MDDGKIQIETILPECDVSGTHLAQETPREGKMKQEELVSRSPCRQGAVTRSTRDGAGSRLSSWPLVRLELPFKGHGSSQSSCSLCCSGSR